MKKLIQKFSGDGVGARARRSAVWTFIDFSGRQGLRLASNLILTRLLFPEAFGVMALVTVVTAGLTLFSDTGVRPSIIQNARGDDPDFLNTAWTVQIIRGFFLWLATLALAKPIATLYDAPVLAQILPIAGLALVVDGFAPTSIYTLNRHLNLGRVTVIALGGQALGLVIMVILAWQLKSVWALVVGGVITSLLTTVAYYVLLPGKKNRLMIEKEAFFQIFDFGKWIFLSTAASFIMNQGDRAILGLYVQLEVLGIYNIGYFLGSVPVILFAALQSRLVLPLYRIKSPAESAENKRALFRVRRVIAFGMLVVAALLSFIGPPLVAALYDIRYAAAGAMITLYSLSLVPLISLNTVGGALLGLGDSRAMFFVFGMTALLQVCLLTFGIWAFGIPGALLSPGLAILMSYPLRLIYSVKYDVFDPLQDFGLTLLGLSFAAAGCAMHWSAVEALFSL